MRDQTNAWLGDTFRLIRAWRGETLLSTLWLIEVISRLPGLRNPYRALIVHLIKRTNHFDDVYYLETHGDVAQTGIPALLHYAVYGDREGCSPMAFFDTAYYRSHARSRTKNVNALLHYVHVGRYRRISPSPWFDVAYYLANNKDVARAGLDPLLHYLKWGGLEGRSPCPQFDSAYYLRANPEIAEAGINPLVHYLRYGRREERSTLPEHRGGGKFVVAAGNVPLPLLFREESWTALPARSKPGFAQVDVVVPVYKGLVETLRCLRSVLAATCKTPFELVVINDASPDSHLVEQLSRLAGKGLFTLLSNAENRGYVYSTNRGMALHTDRDVVLLNSDTEVYDGWLDRLQQAAWRNRRTGTVTPLSNNATICSYPHFLHDNPYPLELAYAELDALTASVNAGFEVETPTGIGFCMYITRVCMNEVGLFDEKVFGKGYGEENDFCQRAIQKGWRNVIAADVFVRHWGAISFQGEKARRIQAALKIMSRQHPRYLKDVAKFIQRDPLKEARLRLDWARMRRARRERNVLIVSHNRGGGTERHVREEIRRIEREGYGVFLLRPKPGQPSHGVLGHPAIKSMPNMHALPLADTAALKSPLMELGITEVHTHSLVDFVPEAPDYLTALTKETGMRWEVKLHDYTVICPRINLVNGSGRYCGEPHVHQCNRCLMKDGSSFGVTDIVAWRAMHQRSLRAADKVLVPDQDVAERLARYFTEVRFEVVSHEQLEPRQPPVQLPDLLPNEKLRVVAIGAISKIKGYDVLLACAKDARQRKLPLKFIVMGHTPNDRRLEATGVTVTGPYVEEEALDRLCSLSPHVAWLPSLWPETYSYTLSLALKSGLPVFAFDTGAIARRLRSLRMGEGLLPLDWTSRPSLVNEALMKWRSDVLSQSGKLATPGTSGRDNRTLEEPAN